MSVPLGVDGRQSSAETSPVEIATLENADAPRWDAYVRGCPEATFFHLAAWRNVIERAFGHRIYYLYAHSGGEIRGILPLGHIRSRLFGDALISLPFAVYGGIAASDAAARSSLEDAAVRMAQELAVDYLELRNQRPQQPGWPTKSDKYVFFRKAISADHQANLMAIPRKQRAMVRKGMQAGLVAEVDDDIDRFFALYSESVRNLGTPVFSKRYFQILRETFRDETELLTISKEGRPMSAVLSFFFRDEVLPYYGGGAEEARSVKANDFMYWSVMCRAADRGCRVFDYGRSKRDTGAFSFKKNWGFEPTPLHYQYHLVRANDVPDVSPTNPKYRLFVDAWKRLPLGVSRWVGPMIARNLG